MAGYNKIHVNLSDSQLNKLKNTTKTQASVTLRISKKMVEGNNLPH